MICCVRYLGKVGHGGSSLVAVGAVSVGELLPTFRMKLVAPSSGSRSCSTDMSIRRATHCIMQETSVFSSLSDVRCREVESLSRHVKQEAVFRFRTV